MTVFLNCTWGDRQWTVFIQMNNKEVCWLWVYSCSNVLFFLFEVKVLFVKIKSVKDFKNLYINFSVRKFQKLKTNFPAWRSKNQIQISVISTFFKSTLSRLFFRVESNSSFDKFHILNFQKFVNKFLSAEVKKFKNKFLSVEVWKLKTNFQAWKSKNSSYCNQFNAAFYRAIHLQQEFTSSITCFLSHLEWEEKTSYHIF